MFVKGLVMLEVESPNTLPNIYLLSNFHILFFSLLKWTLGKRKKQME
jgi:hypothetical protein